MKSKKIINIVFYKFYGENGADKKACIFYRDGSVEDTSYERGLDACEEIAKERKITSKDAFKEMINKEIVHVMSGEDLKNNFQNFVSHEIIDQDIIDDAIEESMQKVKVSKPTKKESLPVVEEKKEVLPRVVSPIISNQPVESIVKETETEEKDNETIIPVAPITTEEDVDVDSAAEVEKDLEETEEIEIVDDNDISPVTQKENLVDATIVAPAAAVAAAAAKKATEKVEEAVDSDGKEEIESAISEEDDVVDVIDSEEEIEDIPVDDFDEEIDDTLPMETLDEEIEDKDIEKPEEKKEGKGIKGFFKRQWEKFKHSRLGVKITAIGIALLMAFGLYSCSARQTKEGQMLNSNITASQLADNTDENNNPLTSLVNGTKQEVDTTKTVSARTLVRGDNTYYNDYTYSELLEVTENEAQKTAMTNLGTAIQGFNGPFADAHVEEGKDIRAALTFEEVIALQQAYNDYSKEDIKAIFNGAEINSDELTRAYKDASLQLMGAYAIETSESPVDMSMLLETEEGREFYQRYHEMFLAAKESTGEEQLENVRQFYEAVRNDFPITQEIRTEGIAHADAYDSIESYKLSVTPMIAAAEMMFQNLEVDYTLQGGDCHMEGEIDFLNDIGLCNRAEEKFERIELITLTACEDDKTNPLYEQYRSAIIKMLTEKDQYVIDDAHRELTKLDAFQEAVNGHFDEVGEGEWVYTGGYSESTETHTETKTWTETKTEYRVEEERHEETIPEEEKAKIDAEIEKENEEAKKKAEEEAERERQRLQEEADREAAKIEEEVEADAKDLQDKIEEANDQIEKNQDGDASNDKPVNESDFGDHGVDFDAEHEDGNGNLNDSVQNITTDSTGDQTGKDLPDPNATGAEFDAQAPAYTETHTEEQVVVEYEEPVVEEPVISSDDSGTQARVEDTSSHEESHSPAVDSEPSSSSSSSDEEVYIEYVSDDAYIEYPADYKPLGDTVGKTNEEIVEEYIEAMAAETVEETAYEYTK